MSVTNEEGGDSPCWAHLFEDSAQPAARREVDAAAASLMAGRDGDQEMIVDLADLARSETAHGAAWTHQSEDLNANLLVFATGGGVAEHENAEVDVLLVGIAGEGVVDVDGTPHVVRCGRVLVIPKGARRGTRAVSDRFAYLTCHRRRTGLWPSGGPRSGAPVRNRRGDHPSEAPGVLDGSS